MSVVGMAATPSGNGYWLVTGDGYTRAFGDAQFRGSMGGQPLNRPIVGMAATPSGNGYWLVAADSGIFTFGDAAFHGTLIGRPVSRGPVVGMAATPSGNGYWLVDTSGGVFSLGGAAFHGSMGGQPLNRPVVGMAATPSGNGYWLVAADGGVFTFGDAQFHGSWVAPSPPSPPQVRVPNVVNLALNIAREVLSQAKLHLGYVYNPTGEIRDAMLTVAGQSPTAGTMVSQGSFVSLRVALAVPMQGVRQLNLYNCNTDGRMVHIWLYDGNGQNWQERGDLNTQYDSNGLCPSQNATPLEITLSDANVYIVVAVDVDNINCGINDPTVISCQRWSYTVTGDSNGQVQQYTIS